MAKKASTQASAAQAPAFETSMKRLEDIVARLENGSVPLEEALALYEEGVTISKECLETLNKAELRLKVLTKSVAKDFDEAFDVSDEPEEE